MVSQFRFKKRRRRRLEVPMFVEHTTVSFTQGRQMLILPETSYCTRLNIACVQMQENRKFYLAGIHMDFREQKLGLTGGPVTVWDTDYCSKRKEVESKHRHAWCTRFVQTVILAATLPSTTSSISYIPVDLCCNSFAILLHCMCYALVYLYYLLAAL
jgi:hypothetical protein